MTKFKELIEKYVNGSSDEDMRKLTHKIDCFVEEVREMRPEMVDCFLMKIDLILNPSFTKETAKYAVSEMKNKDGTTGEHWDYNTTTHVLESKKYNFKPCDWYYVLNMIYSDYYKSGRSDETYIEMAFDFLEDKDSVENKAKRYYKAMHY